MTEYQREIIHCYLSLMKETMYRNRLIFGMSVDKEKPERFMLYFMDREKYFSEGIADGISISLEELNRGLMGEDERET